MVAPTHLLRSPAAVGCFRVISGVRLRRHRSPSKHKLSRSSRPVRTRNATTALHPQLYGPSPRKVGGEIEDFSRGASVTILPIIDEGKASSVVLCVCADRAELETLRRLERFFALRNGKYRKRNLDQRFRTLQKLLQAHQRLRMADPERVEGMREHLNEFERLCKWMGVRDYHLTVEYTPRLIAKFIGRSLAMIFLALPIGLWGAINSIVPFLLTRELAHRLSADRYQYDTAKICLGMGFFALFWGAQTWLVARWTGDLSVGVWFPWLYAASLLPATMLALYMRRERERILDNVRVFLKFTRQNDLREFLTAKRKALEREMARLVYLSLQTRKVA